MSKSENIKQKYKEMVSRIELLENTAKDLKVWSDFGDGGFYQDTNDRIKRAKIALKDFTEKNLEYII